jgi:hypothetical protein
MVEQVFEFVPYLYKYNFFKRAATTWNKTTNNGTSNNENVKKDKKNSPKQVGKL